MNTLKVSGLNGGDIFSFGENSWDAAYRFEGVRFYDDSSSMWKSEFKVGCRICFWLSSIFGDGRFRGTVKWSNTNSMEQIVYIPQYPMSAHKKTKDKYCIPIGNQRRRELQSQFSEIKTIIS